MKQSFKTKAKQGTLSYSVIGWALVVLAAIVSLIFYNLYN